MQTSSISMMLITSLFFTNYLQAQENTANTESLDKLSKHLSTIIAPEPIKRVEPKYPIKAARDGREGWTILSFVINEEGKVEDVIVKESSGSKDITKASIKSVKKWRYKPAMENGKAIQQCVNTVQLDFRMGKPGGGDKGTMGVSKRFKRKYKKARQAYEDKDYDELEKQLASMKENKYRHLSENNYMHLLAADYANVRDEKEQQLYHLIRVRMSRLSNDKQKLSLLYQKFNLQVELNKFQAAHRTYEKLIKLPSAKPYLSQFSETMAKVESAISGDKNLVISADIKEDFWSAELVRKEFSLIDVEGSLHTLDVRCANKRHVYTIGENSTWKLPTSWENCSIYVFGEPNTQFKLIEHPLKS
ncbi:MAG: energy transducer TonB [Colwellia sp.]|nr:energy transducer TonB [Colwellia sp.]